MVVFREGKTQTLKITLGRREAAEGAVPAAMAKPAEAEEESTELTEKLILGLTLNQLTEELRTQLELGAKANGLVVTDIDALSEAFEKGIRPGDLITEAGQQKLNTIADLDARISEAKDAGRKSLLLLVRRAGEPRFVALSLEPPAATAE